MAPSPPRMRPAASTFLEIKAMHRKARELTRGDVFQLRIFGEVLETKLFADGKRTKVIFQIEDQGHRAIDGGCDFDKPSSLEFLGGGRLEFICKPNRSSQLHEWWGDGDDDDDGDGEIVDPPPSLEHA
jgi:hypothetical protein